MTVDHPSAGRRLTLVVGIGRSGTSALTGMLGRLGLHIPQPEVQADDTNPRGFGEPRWVVDFHQRLMRHRRITVFDSRPAAWDAASDAADSEEVVTELRSWLEVQYVGVDHIVVKDPRVTWFLPLWSNCAAALGARTSFVTLLRHPAEVVASARKWYGTWQNDASRAAAWVNVTLGTERGTRGEPRAFVRYTDLLEERSREIVRVGRLIDEPQLAAADLASLAAADALIDPDLRREAAGSHDGWHDVPVPESLKALVEEVWSRMSQLAEPDGDGAREHAALDELRNEYERFYAEAEAVSQSSVTAVKPRRKPAPPATPASSPAARYANRTMVAAERFIRRSVWRRLPFSVRRRALRAGRRALQALRQ